MTYIRTLNQADWFFNPGKTPGGLEPTGAAAPPLPGAPGTPPRPTAPSTPVPATSEPAEAADAEKAPTTKSVSPVLAKKTSAPFGWYLLGGLALVVIGVILYKKFRKDVTTDVEVPTSETISEVSRKKKRK